MSARRVVQGLTRFVAILLSAAHSAGRRRLDACPIVFAVVCVAILTRQRVVQGALLAGPMRLVVARRVDGRLSGHSGVDPGTLTELIAFSAFAFNGLITARVARHGFGPGRVTAPRVRGAVRLYLNVTALFSRADNAFETHWPGAFVPAAGVLATASGMRTAALPYFSLTTITTTGYGNLAPIPPRARRWATLAAVFGPLFPATLLARLIALQLAHEGTGAHTPPARESLDSGGRVEAQSTDRLRTACPPSLNVATFSPWGWLEAR